MNTDFQKRLRREIRVQLRIPVHHVFISGGWTAVFWVPESDTILTQKPVIFRLWHNLTQANWLTQSDQFFLLPVAHW